MLLLASIFFFFVSLSTFHWISYSSQYLELSSVCCYLPPQSPGWIITLCGHAGSLVSVAAVSPSHCHMRNRSWRAATSSSSVYTGTCTFAPQSFTQMIDMTVWQQGRPCCWLKSKSAAPTAAPGPHWRWCGGGAGAGNPSSHPPPPPPPLYSAGQCGVSTI